MTLTGALELLVIGFGASVFGSLVGLGGGFIVVPILRLVFGVPPAQAAGTSLLFVFANVVSAAYVYVRDKKVDLGLALPFVVGALPGNILGVYVLRYFTPASFDIVYGIMLAFLSIVVLRRRGVVSREPHERTFAHHPLVGGASGFAIGVASSLFGIGGGIVFVPLLLVAARMSPHIVTATSAFVIAFTAPIGVVTHGVAGDIRFLDALPLVIGGIAGGAIGPRISRRVSSPRLVTLLAIALMAAAAGLALRHIR